MRNGRQMVIQMGEKTVKQVREVTGEATKDRNKGRYLPIHKKE